MLSVLPRIYKYEVMNLLLPVFLMQSVWGARMTNIFTGQPDWTLNWLTTIGFFVGMLGPIVAWRHRQKTYLSLPAGKRPKVPYPIDVNGKAIL
jgi:hypothetical protein